MSDVHNSLRLGDLLVEKGLITRPQLRQAIEIQQALQSQRFGGKNINGRTELGEILIELGFISRHQLQSNLNWQRRLKATTAVMVFIAPLLTAACGGGGGGSPSSNTAGNVKTEIASSQASVASPLPKPDQASSYSSIENASSANGSSVNAESTLPDTAPAPVPALSSSSKMSSSKLSSSSSSSAPTSTLNSSSKVSASSQSKISSSSSSPKAISSASSSKVSSLSSSTATSSSSKISSASSKAISSSSLSSAASSSSSRNIDGSVQLFWNVPNQRENGDYLDVTEIGGYELRYKLKNENTFKSILIKDGFTDAYYFQYLKGDYEFQIATFDNTGLYSSFVSVNPS